MMMAHDDDDSPDVPMKERPIQPVVEYFLEQELILILLLSPIQVLL